MGDNLKSGRRDQHLVRETTDEMHEEINQERLPPKYEKPNRDRTRGDWDRSRMHTNDPGETT